MAGALAMAASLVMSQCKVVCESVLRSILLAGRLLTGRKKEKKAGNECWSEEGEEEEAAMYEGVVWHERRHPVHHQFEVKARYALVNLDKTPSWFAASSRHHMTGDQARSLVGTSGPVHLLCMPTSVGYEQNPLSVYYCYNNDDAAGPQGSSSSLSKTIAEVTNTPWAERVTFAFDAQDDTVAKPLHVSPFMDMRGAWRMHAPAPGEKLSLTIRVEHPEFGNLFVATLRARRVEPAQSPERFLWLMPQKVAVLIYWQALVLMWKGVAFVQHPKYVDGDLYRKRAQDRDAELRGKMSPKEAEGEGPAVNGGDVGAVCPRFFKWREADGHPWL